MYIFQPLSDIMPDIALAGASLSALSLSRSAPSPRPPGPLALSPDLVEQVEIRSKFKIMIN